MKIYHYKNSLNFFIEPFSLTYKLSENEKKFLQVKRKKLPKNVESYSFEELYGDLSWWEISFIIMWEDLDTPFSKKIKEGIEDLCKLFNLEKSKNAKYLIKISVEKGKKVNFIQQNTIFISWFSMEYPKEDTTIVKHMGTLFVAAHTEVDIFYYYQTKLNYSYEFQDDKVYLKLKRLAEP